MRRAKNLTTFIHRLSRNSGASTFRNPKGLSRPVVGKLYLYLICVKTAKKKKYFYHSALDAMKIRKVSRALRSTLIYRYISHLVLQAVVLSVAHIIFILCLFQFVIGHVGKYSCLIPSLPLPTLSAFISVAPILIIYLMLFSLDKT